MLQERVSVAPMLEWTDPHFRMLMRGITRKSVLYTEMLVDEAVHHSHPSLLDFMLGKAIDEDASVIQLGGYDPEMMANAAAKCEEYCSGSYAEININCGCPSQRVAKRCFGAQLMLQPDTVQQMVRTMQRRVHTPITIKCRIGVDAADSYEDLKHFVTQTCVLTGVKKLVLHARKAINGLNTKQNRAVPPLRYDVAHQLAKDFPDLAIVLNGGLQDLDAAAVHVQSFAYTRDSANPYDYIHWSPVLGKRPLNEPDVDSVMLPAMHGVMLGRAVYSNPLVLADADSRFYGARDPCLTRRQILERYMDYCDHVQSDAGPRRIMGSANHAHGHDSGGARVTCAILLNAMRNVINHVKNVTKYRQELNDIYMEEQRRLGGKEVAYPSARTVIEGAMRVLDEDQLDAPVGDAEFYPNALA